MSFYVLNPLKNKGKPPSVLAQLGKPERSFGTLSGSLF
jgi:hypothetical protein